MLGNIIALTITTFITTFVKNFVYRIVRVCFGDEYQKDNRYQQQQYNSQYSNNYVS